MLILGILGILRFWKIKFDGTDKKKKLARPDFFDFEGFGTLLENGQVVLTNSKKLDLAVTCLNILILSLTISCWRSNFYV